MTAAKKDEGSSVLSLPAELLIKILSKLDCRSLLACREVCRLLCKFVDEDISLQYIIELAAANMDDSTNSTLTTAERLDALKKLQAAWNKLEWTRVDTLRTVEQNMWYWELDGGVLAQSRHNHSVIYFTQLPSTMLGIQQKQWEIDFAGFGIQYIHCNFKLDPAQDLLIIVEMSPASHHTPDWTLHFRLPATGVAHPLANPGSFTTTRGGVGRSNLNGFDIQVCGEIVAIKHHYGRADGGPGNELIVCNWKTGREHMIITFSGASFTFAFLSSRYLLVGMDTDTYLRTGDMNTFLVLDIDHGINRMMDVREMDYVCSFECPKFESYTHLVIGIRSDTSPIGKPSPNSQLPFSVTPDRRVFVIGLTYLNHRQRNMKEYDLFVPTDTFMTCLRKVLVEGSHKPRNFRWDEWGLRGTRLLSHTPQFRPWGYFHHGMKVVKHKLDESGVVIEVLDFNQWALKRENLNGGASAGNVEVVTNPSHHTYLPYRSIKCSIPHSLLQGIRLRVTMCTGDALILVGESDDLFTEFRVLSF